MADEIVDFFDGDERWIMRAPLSTKHGKNTMLFVKCAHIFIINDKKEILIQRKKENHSKFNRWEIPSGHLHSKESYEEAAKRELKEETGIAVPLQLLRIAKFQSEKEFVGFFVGHCNKLPSAKGNAEADAFEYVSYPSLIRELRGKIREGARIFSPQMISFLGAYGEMLKKYLRIDRQK